MLNLGIESKVNIFGYAAKKLKFYSKISKILKNIFRNITQNKKSTQMQKILSEITLDHTFDDIIKIFKKNGLVLETVAKQALCEKLRPYIGPYPGTKFEGGFAFFISTSSRDNRGVYRKPLEGYKHLPFKITEIYDDPTHTRDWYNYGLGEQEDCIQKFALDTDPKVLENHLLNYMNHQAAFFEKYTSITPKDDCEIKLEKIRKFVVERFIEFRNIITGELQSCEIFNELFLLFGNQMDVIRDYLGFETISDFHSYMYLLPTTRKCIVNLLLDRYLPGGLEQIVSENIGNGPITSDLLDSRTRDLLVLIKIAMRRKIPFLILAYTSKYLIFNYKIISHEFGNTFTKVPENEWICISPKYVLKHLLVNSCGPIRARKCDVAEGQDHTDFFYAVAELKRNAEDKWLIFENGLPDFLDDNKKCLTLQKMLEIGFVEKTGDRYILTESGKDQSKKDDISFHRYDYDSNEEAVEPEWNDSPEELEEYRKMIDSLRE